MLAGVKGVELALTGQAAVIPHLWARESAAWKEPKANKYIFGPPAGRLAVCRHSMSLLSLTIVKDETEPKLRQYTLKPQNTNSDNTHSSCVCVCVLPHLGFKTILRKLVFTISTCLSCYSGLMPIPPAAGLVPCHSGSLRRHNGPEIYS